MNIGEVMTAFVKAWTPSIEAMAKRFQELTEALSTLRLYPIVENRDEVRRVHIAYRQRRRGRW